MKFRLKYKSKTTKFLERNIEEILYDTGLGKGLYFVI